MHLIIDNGAYTLRNMGDVAMLQVTLARARSAYPAAEYSVLTSRPDLLPRYCPGTTALSVESRNELYTPSRSPQPSRWKTFWRRVRGKKTGKRPDPAEFARVLEASDGVLVAGGGFLNDLNRQAALAILRMLADAQDKRKTVALFGQGLGPLEDPELTACLRKIIGAGAWMSLREGRRGPALIGREEASAKRVAVTGDDALEVAWREHWTPSGLGSSIGFSMRQIAYSGIETAHAGRISRALASLRSRLNAEVVPLPISFNSFEDDPSSIARIAGQPVDAEALAEPGRIVLAAAKSRVVLTGTYHAAVFALAQGVPCVCFHASPYYRDKLEGLCTQFGNGCVLVDIRQDDAIQTIAAEGERLWNSAATLGPSLWEAAGKQVRAARDFYGRALNSFTHA